MSLANEQLLTCPECNHQTNTKVWGSVNTDINPEMREAIFKGEINLFICEKCQHKAFINTEFLYHDMARKFSIYYYPPESLKQDNFYEQFEKNFPIKRNMPGMEGMEHLLEGSEHLIKAHVTFSMNNLLYTILFYERLLDQAEEEKEKE